MARKWASGRGALALCMLLPATIVPALGEAESAPSLVVKGAKQYTSALTDADFEKAVRYFEEAVDVDREYIPARVWLGIAYAESAAWKQRREKTIEQFQEALRLPDTENAYERYRRTAKDMLLRIRGRPARIAICAPEAASWTYREAGGQILQAMRIKAGEPYPAKRWNTVCRYEVVPPESVGYEPGRSDAELYAEARALEESGVGWIAIVTVESVGEPQRYTTDKGEVRWHAPDTKAQVTVLDCALGRRLWSFTAEKGFSIGGYSSPDAAVEFALRSCGEDAALGVLRVIAPEDCALKAAGAWPSVLTDAPMVFAYTGITDRAKARQLPLIALPRTEGATQGSDPRMLETVVRVVTDELRTGLVRAETFAVVDHRQLDKLRDELPLAWTTEGSGELAGKLGDRCEGVFVTRIRESKAWVDRKVLLPDKVRASVVLDGTFFRRTDRPLPLAVEESRSLPGQMGGGDYEEKQYTLLLNVAVQAAEKLCRKLIAATSPATVAVLPFAVGGNVRGPLQGSADSVQEKVSEALQVSGAFKVLSPSDVNNVAGNVPQKKALEGLASELGATAAVTGKVKAIDVARPTRREPSKATVKVVLSAAVVELASGEQLETFDAEAEEVAEVGEIGKRAKLQEMPEVQQAARKAAERAATDLAKKLAAFIRTHEEQL